MIRFALAALSSVALWVAAVLPASGAPVWMPTPPREARLTPPEPPTVSASSWIVYDHDADIVLGSHNPRERRAMASTTKMMTALLAIERGDLAAPVVVSERATAVGEAAVGLVAGETVPLGLLVSALVARSGNDAATAVAEHIGGSVEGFVALMNERAASLGLVDTHFANPHGLDGENHYSSAADLLTLALEVMAHPEYREWARLKEAPFPDAPDGTRRTIVTTNLMLDTYPGTIGVKTGWTGKAGLVFVAAAARHGHTIYVVVMGSQGERGHFEDTRRLFDWAFAHYAPLQLLAVQPTVEAEQPPEEPPPPPEPVLVTVERRPEGLAASLGDAFAWMARVWEWDRGG